MDDATGFALMCEGACGCDADLEDELGSSTLGDCELDQSRGALVRRLPSSPRRSV